MPSALYFSLPFTVSVSSSWSQYFSSHYPAVMEYNLHAFTQERYFTWVFTFWRHMFHLLKVHYVVLGYMF